MVKFAFCVVGFDPINIQTSQAHQHNCDNNIIALKKQLQGIILSFFIDLKWP